MGDRGGTATRVQRIDEVLEVYPMGDRGGTATIAVSRSMLPKFIRWEIGEEPQQAHARQPVLVQFIRWEIGEEPQLENPLPPPPLRVYPMGDRGGTATTPPSVLTAC